MHLVHVSHQRHGRAAPNTASPSQKEGATGEGQDAIHMRYIVQDLAEQQNVQVSVFSAWKQAMSQSQIWLFIYQWGY